MIGCVYDYTKTKSHRRIVELSQTFPVKEIQKKRDCARGMRVFRARKTRARTREPAEMAMMTIHIIIRLDMI